MEKWRDAFRQEQVRDITWGCALASQMGFVIAGPVLLGLGAGYWLDLRLGTLPWITLGLTAAGAIGGPIIAYRWVATAMRRRFAGREQAEEEHQD